MQSGNRPQESSLLARIRRDVAGSTLLKRTLLVCVVALSILRVVGYRDLMTSVVAVRNDFTPDYVSAKALTSGDDPYARLDDLYQRHLGRDADLIFHLDPGQRNAHPPALIVLMIPFTAVGIRTARAVWFFVIIVATFSAVFVFARRVGFGAALAAVLAIAALALPVVESDLRWAQIDGLILLLLVWAWVDLRDGHERRAGAILGIATAIKVFPWLLIVPLIRARRRRAVIWFGTAAAAVSLAGIWIVGLHSTWEFLTVGSPRDVRFWSHVSMGSLVASPHQWLSAPEGLDPSGGPLVLLYGMSAVFFVACLVAAMRMPARATGDPFWAVIPIVILIAPISWPFYFVLLVPLGVLFLRRFEALPTGTRLMLAAAIGSMLVGLPLIDWLHGSIGIANRLPVLAALILIVVADFLPAPELAPSVAV